MSRTVRHTCTVTNQVFNVVASKQSDDPSPEATGRTPVVVDSPGALPPTWEIERQESGAYHIVLPAVPNAGPRRLVGYKNKLYAEDVNIAPAEPADVVEWEVLATARDGTSPDYAKLNGIYIITARGNPRMVWTLPNGATNTQVKVVDLFTADERTNVNESTADISTSTEPTWKPRQWLWQITPVDPANPFSA